MSRSSHVQAALVGVREPTIKKKIIIIAKIIARLDVGEQTTRRTDEDILTLGYLDPDLPL